MLPLLRAPPAPTPSATPHGSLHLAMRTSWSLAALNRVFIHWPSEALRAREAWLQATMTIRPRPRARLMRIGRGLLWVRGLLFWFSRYTLPIYLLSSVLTTAGTRARQSSRRSHLRGTQRLWHLRRRISHHRTQRKRRGRADSYEKSSPQRQYSPRGSGLYQRARHVDDCRRCGRKRSHQGFTPDTKWEKGS